MFTSFLQLHLSSWLQCQHEDAGGSSNLSQIYSTGIELIFNVDILRLSLPPPNLLASLSQHASAIPVLPRILESYTHALKKFKGTLFSKTAVTRDAINDAAMGFFSVCEDLLNGGLDGPPLSTWESRKALVDVIEKQDVGSAKDDTLKNISQKAIHVLELEECDIGVKFLAVEVFTSLLRVDYELVRPVVSRILRSFLFVGFPFLL